MIKRFLKWVITVVLFRKVATVLSLILRRLGFKGMVFMGVIAWVVSLFINHC